MFAAIATAEFALQSALRHMPELWLQPVALLTPAGARSFLTECTPAALEAGVSPGMTSSQGLARCATLLIRPRSPVAEECAAAALVDIASTLSPWVEETAPGICTLELRGERLPPLAQVAETLLTRLTRVALRSQIGFAPRPDLALLAARSALPDPGWREVRHARELHTLPLTVLAFPAPMLEILSQWGIRDLAGFTALGRTALAERLGPEILPLLNQAEGTVERPLRCLPPVESYTEAVEFEQEIETLEPLLFMLRRLLEQIACRLEATYLVAACLEFRLGLAQGAEYTRSFKIPAPTARVEVLFRALYTHLERFTAEHPIISLHLSARPCRPPRQQFGLFESALRDPNQFFETLARLAALLGSDRIGVPRLRETWRPDAFHLGEVDPGPEDHSLFSVAAPLSSAPALAPAPVTLCLRRFRPPLPAEVELDALTRRPVSLTSPALRGPARAAHGPVCLSGEWWDERRWKRAEWELELTDGTLCRLYYERSRWYLDGVYD